MSELLRTFVGRIREYAGDRRHSARRRARLDFTVTPAIPAKVNGLRPESLPGYTRDISANGLGLIVPAIRIGDRYLAGGNCRLALSLELPHETIQMIVTSYRYEPLEDDEDQGYLIGTRITDINEHDRELFMTYLNDLEQ
jgi:hypothetical protein